MTLKEFLATLPRGTQGQFARRCEIDPIYLSQLAARVLSARVVEPSAQLAVRIETESEGAVTRRELRPEDWGDIWPELIDADHPWPAKTAIENVAGVSEAANA